MRNSLTSGSYFPANASNTASLWRLPYLLLSQPQFSCPSSSVRGTTTQDRMMETHIIYGSNNRVPSKAPQRIPRRAIAAEPLINIASLAKQMEEDMAAGDQRGGGRDCPLDLPAICPRPFPERTRRRPEQPRAARTRPAPRAPNGATRRSAAIATAAPAS